MRIQTISQEYCTNETCVSTTIIRVNVPICFNSDTHRKNGLRSLLVFLFQLIICSKAALFYILYATMNYSVHSTRNYSIHWHNIVLLERSGEAEQTQNENKRHPYKIMAGKRKAFVIFFRKVIHNDQ